MTLFFYRLYGLDALLDYCYNFLDKNATDILQHESFLQLSVVSC